MSKLFLISPSDVLNSGTQQTPLEAYLNYSFPGRVKLGLITCFFGILKYSMIIYLGLLPKRE